MYASLDFLDFCSQVQEAIDIGIPFLTLKKVQNGQAHPQKYEESPEIRDLDKSNNERLNNRAVPGFVGIELVLSCMEEYPDNSKVQKNALNVILTTIMLTVKNKCNQCSDKGREALPLQHPRCIPSVLKALELPVYNDNTSIQWRAISILMELTGRSQEICRLVVAGENGCDALLNACTRFQKDPALLQIALWTLANLCQEGTTILRSLFTKTWRLTIVFS